MERVFLNKTNITSFQYLKFQYLKLHLGVRKYLHPYFQQPPYLPAAASASSSVPEEIDSLITPRTRSASAAIATGTATPTVKVLFVISSDPPAACISFRRSLLEGLGFGPLASARACCRVCVVTTAGIWAEAVGAPFRVFGDGLGFAAAFVTPAPAATATEAPEGSGAVVFVTPRRTRPGRFQTCARTWVSLF